MLNLVSKCRSLVNSIQTYGRFKFALLFVSPVVLLLSAWIHRTVPVPKDFGYYAATNDSAIQRYAEALDIELLLQILLFVSFSVVLFLLFRLALGNILSFLAVVAFMTNAQVILVYLSAPFWDFATAVIPLMAITGTVALLSAQYQNLSLTRNTRRRFVVTIICLDLLIVSIHLRVYYSSTQQMSSIFAAAIVLLLIAFIWLRSEKIEAKSKSQTVLGANGCDRLFFIPILFLLLLLQPFLGRGGESYATGFLVVCLLVFVSSENLLRTGYKFVISTLFFLVVLLRGDGAGLLFYSFSGWQGAVQLVSGQGGGFHSFGIPFTDAAISQINEANTGRGLIFQNIALNFPSIVKNLELGWTYLSDGFWKFSEPPIGLNSGALNQVRNRLIGAVSPISPILFISAAIICFQKSRRVALFLSLIILVFLFAIGLTRPQMHQWWVLQIFGLYGALYSMSCLSKNVAKIFFSQTSPIRFKDRSLFFDKQGFVFKLKISKKIVVRFLFLLSIFVVSPKIVFSVLTNASEKLETTLLAALATEYGQQNWEPISVENGDTKNITLQRESNFLKVEVSENCTLTGVRIYYLESGISDDFELEKAEYYRTKFHVANTSSKIVYVPFFPRTDPKPAVSVVGAKANCSLRVYEASLLGQTLPNVALLVPNEENMQVKVLAEEVKITNRSDEMLSDPLSFEGYVRNRGYQAVGDEFSNKWISDQITDRILGRSRQGYQVVDIWRQKIDLKSDAMRVIVRGSRQRGIIITGWAISDPAARSVIPPDFDYVVSGSIFDHTARSLFECFELPPAEKIEKGSIVEFFVGSVFDLYSPRWTNYQIDSIILENGSCGSKLQPRNFLPTL